MSADAPLLSLRAVRKRFRDVVAVDGADLDVAPGRITGLLGPNGAGKTTLLRLVLDIWRPDGGEILLRGRPLRRADLDAIGYLPEERGLYLRERVLDLLAYLGQLKGMTRAAARDAARHWLQRLGIAEHAERRVGSLSKGNQQKVQLAGTLLHAPTLLVWDEPFSGLDPINVVQLRELLRELRDAGTSVLLSTHLMSQAEQLCDSVALMARGRVVRVADRPFDDLEGVFLDAVRG